MEFTLKELYLFFIIYSFIGWIIEVVFHIFTEKRFINRGFLYGPLTPIYGNGAVIMILALSPLKNNIFSLFIGGFLIASILEYITGYVLERVFHTKWWDYSDMKWNINGYVSLVFSLAWGLASIILMKVIHPEIIKILDIIPTSFKNIFIPISMVFLTLDFIMTVKSLIEIRKILIQIEAIRKDLTLALQDREKKIKKKLDIFMENSRRAQKRYFRNYPNLIGSKIKYTTNEIKKKIKKK